jgi:predicted SnoaL-like aldol condensation-catalyzing enzyme
MNKPNRIIIALMLAAAAVNVSAKTTKHHHLQSTKEIKMEQNANKQVALNAVQAFFKDYDADGIKKYFAQDYIQHNPHVPTGIEPVLGFAPLLKQAGTTTQNHRIIADGDLVVMHNTYDNAEAFGAKKVVTFDIFRIANGKVAEHWDAINPLVEKTASGRTQVDGPTQVTDLDKTTANKTLVKNFVDDVLFGKAPQKITDYISTTQYHQHNVGIKDGLDGLNEAIGALIAQNNMFKYNKVHKVLGEGNFVVTVSEGEWNGKPQAFYDLFRVENGKIVEHWDVVQEIPAQMAHSNGMF